MSAFIESDFFAFVDAHEQLYKDRLAEAVAFPSISAEIDEHLHDIINMMEWTQGHIERLGGTVTMAPNPLATAHAKLPPILMASFAKDPNKKTVCVYGHLDVQPAAKDDGWDTDPFVLTEKDGKLYGRGSTDDKGPALSWLWVIEAHQKLGIEMPVNIKILFEGMEENGSEGLYETIQMEAQPGKFYMMLISFAFRTIIGSERTSRVLPTVCEALPIFSWKFTAVSKIYTLESWEERSTRQ
jgi:acetylornithine deacetylase/succinyl-diaminopimelate desuccinylase-like protein